MMIVGKNRITNHMSMEFEFSGIRLLEGSLIPVEWEISVDLVAIEKNKKLKEDAEKNASIAYQRLFFWLETNLPGIIVVDVGNSEDLYIANLSTNVMMYCPGIPYNDTIAQLLHSKLTKISDNKIIIGEIRVRSSDMSAVYSYNVGDDGYDLPDTTQYYTEGKMRDEVPWWRRNDGFSFDFILPDELSTPVEDLFNDIVDPLNEFDKLVNESFDKFGAVKEPARIVQVDKWKPRKVE